MEYGSRHHLGPGHEFMATPGYSDYSCLEARAQAFEEAVSMALFASAWLQHRRKDARASQSARLIARLLASCSNQPTLQGPDAFAAARQFLEDESHE